MLKNRITLEKIYFENFLCFKGLHEFKFHKSGIHRITGKNLDLNPFEDEGEELTEFHNSGSGKSSFLASIAFVFFGEIPKDINKNNVVNKTAKKNCSVICEFYKNDILYKIERYRKHKKFGNRLLFFKQENNSWEELTQDDLKDTQEKINNIIMMNYDTFMKSVLISRDGTKNFSDLNGYERTQLLENLMRLDKFNGFEKKIKLKIAKLNKDVESNYLDITSVFSSIKTLKEVIFKRIKEQREKLENNKKETEKLNLKASGIKKILKTENDITEVINLSKQYLVHLYELNDRIEKYNNELISVKKNKNFISLEIKKYFKINETVKKHRNKFVNINTVKCNTCGNIINEDEIKERQKELKELISDLLFEKKVLADNLRIKIKDVKNNKTAVLKKDAESFKNLEFNLSKEMKKMILQDFQNKNHDVTFLKDLIEIQKKLEFKKSEYNEIRNIDKIKEIHREINLKRKEYKILKIKETDYKKQLETAEFWIKAFDHKNENSIKAFILNKIIPVFNMIFQDFLNKAFDSKLYMSFNSSFEETISFNGELFEFKELSTGERKQINLLINFTILSLVRLNLNSFNIIFLDEIFTSLDANFIKKVIESIRINFAEDSVIYVISHDNINYMNFDSKIKIQKENKESIIINET